MGGNRVGFARTARSAVLVAATLTVLAPFGARAQVGLSLPPVVDEARRGVHFGDFVFVPFLGIEGRYNSNVFRQDSREGRSEAGILTLRPGFKLSNPTPSWLKLTWDASVDVNFWFSKDKNAAKQGRVAADTALRADFLTRSVVGFFVADRFVRTVQAQNYSATGRYDRNFNHAEGGLQIRPGGALEFDLSYAYNFELFDEFKDGNRKYHEARLVGTWAFFPKTSLYLDVNWRYQTWDHQKTGFRSDSMPLRAALGVRGYVTRKIALDVRAGYGQGFYKNGTDVMTFVGGASLAFKPTQFTLLDVGYDRDFEDAAYYARWYVADQVHLTIKQQFLRRLELEGSLVYAYLSFANLKPGPADLPGYVTLTANEADRRDHALTAKATLSYSALRYLSLKVGYQLESIFTDFRMDGVAATGTVTRDYGGFLVHQVFGEVQVLY
jgi:hypothetical protein